MSFLTSTSWDKYRDFGILLLRLGFGILFILHGWPKITGGPEMWGNLGKVMGMFGLGFAPAFWGFLAACTEFFGGILLIFGLFTRWAALLLTFVMVVAASMHLANGDPFPVASHAMKAGIVFLSFIFIGPGRFSLDSRLIACGSPAQEEKAAESGGS